MELLSGTIELLSWLADVVLLIMYSFVMFGCLLLPLVIALATMGKSIGVRRTYVNVLLALFEYLKRTKIGHKKIGCKENLSASLSAENDETSENSECEHTEDNATCKTMKLVSQRSVQEMDTDFQLSDIMYFTKSGLEAIVEDEVTQRFSAEELPSWNLLTRTNTKPQFISIRLTILWACGFITRYIILFPFRLTLALAGIILFLCGTAYIGRMPDGELKKQRYHKLSKTAFRIMARGLSAVVTYHNKENRAKGGGICVANHTSPIDSIILGCDNTYAMVGQKQSGFFGIMEHAMSRATSHVWFNRSEAKDRTTVARRLKEHVQDKHKLPICIFPEGTCINNTSIMMFKKGSFEVGGTIYPAAIKYDARFADPFWNSSKQHLITHILLMLTSWALVCDVWYLPPCEIKEGESGVEFANRVKSLIAQQGGLIDLEWDGALKRKQPSQSFKEKQQEDFSKRLKRE